jgi:hypothetical protein
MEIFSVPRGQDLRGKTCVVGKACVSRTGRRIAMRPAPGGIGGLLGTELPEVRTLAFLVRLGNNSSGTVMRLACVLAIALGLSFPAAGQAPVVPEEPAEKAQAETAPATGQNSPESVAKRKTDADSASGTTKRRKRAAPVPGDAPRKIVVREGGASEPTAQIVPGLTPAEAIHQRQNAERLLGSTDDQLKQLVGRTLDAQQQETVGQEGDVRRASTLAEKARLLAEDLVRH